MNNVYLALNICTYKREEYLLGNIALLKNSLFFTDKDSKYYGKLDIFITDNASELELETDEHVHLFHNPNTGGSGGFQRGIYEIRKSHKSFTNVIFMDDDVKFELSSFYILFDFLSEVSTEFIDRPISGRMLDIDNPNIQWTAAEKWNFGDIQHVEFLRNISDLSNPYTPGKVIFDVDADYGGFWFSCYPYSYVKENDILPFFLHCDDIEYGLRCGKKPIIIEGVQVWHHTWEKNQSIQIKYFDLRNNILLLKKYNKISNWSEYLSTWMHMISSAHSAGDYIEEYVRIKAFNDAIKYYGQIIENKRARKIKGIQIKRTQINTRMIRVINVFFWRIVYFKALIK